MPASSFDCPAFKAACECNDAAAWILFFAEDAEWVEHRHQDPPSRPNRIAEPLMSEIAAGRIVRPVDVEAWD